MNNNLSESIRIPLASPDELPLPKLISGEIRVKDSGQLLKEYRL
jgi:hypothetical protein